MSNAVSEIPHSFSSGRIPEFSMVNAPCLVHSECAVIHWETVVEKVAVPNQPI